MVSVVMGESLQRNHNDIVGDIKLINSEQTGAEPLLHLEINKQAIDGILQHDKYALARSLHDLKSAEALVQHCF